MTDLWQVQSLQLSCQVIQSLSMLHVSPQELLSGSVQFVLCELPKSAGGLHRAAGISGGGVGSSFSFLRLQKVLSDAVCRPWQKQGDEIS